MHHEDRGAVVPGLSPPTDFSRIEPNSSLVAEFVKPAHKGGGAPGRFCVKLLP